MVQSSRWISAYLKRCHGDAVQYVPKNLLSHLPNKPEHRSENFCCWNIFGLILKFSAMLFGPDLIFISYYMLLCTIAQDTVFLGCETVLFQQEGKVPIIQWSTDLISPSSFTEESVNMLQAFLIYVCYVGNVRISCAPHNASRKLPFIENNRLNIYRREDLNSDYTH
jgi:hypothetical protein